MYESIEVKAVNVARLLSELEGCCTLMKYMGFEEDMKVMEEIKGRYYKLYFRLKKLEGG